MSGETFEAHSTEEKLCITQYEQREYDACSWENEDFAGKRAGEEWSRSRELRSERAFVTLLKEESLDSVPR